MKQKYKLMMLIGMVVIIIGLAIHNNIEKEKVWYGINEEYSKISREIELCVYSCSIDCKIFPSTCNFDEMNKCFDGCDIKLNKNLEEIGIKHKAWRDKYVGD